MGRTAGISFGDLLRKRRREAGLTQEELAERAGTSARTVSDIERGKSSTPYRATIDALADALGLDDEGRAQFHAAGTRRRGPARRASGGTVPLDPNPLLGRERDEAELLHMLRFEGARMVTITGPGGVGKTRLAMHVAERMRRDVSAVWFVPLSTIDDPARVPTRVAREIGIDLDGTAEVENALVDALSGQDVLLALDNLEQVIGAGPMLARLLERAPSLRLLLTSREPLRLRAEREYPLLPLALPDLARLPPSGRLAQYPAVALFLDRARAVRPDFRITAENAQAVAGICTRLDGLPLAIELAAAWVRTLSPHALLLRLDRPLGMLAGGPADLPARQQTMRDTIAWSYGHLSPGVAALFRRLSVFAGEMSLDAVEAVCGEAREDVLPGLHELAAKNLVVPQGDAGQDEASWSMLRTIHQFAEEALGAADEAEAVRRAHRDYYLRLAHQADAGLFGPEQERWIRTLDRELDNLRAAFDWSLATPGEGRAALTLAVDLALFWQVRGYLQIGSRWFARALESAGDLDGELLGTALNQAANVENMRGEYGRASELYGQAMARFRELGLIGRVGTVLGNLAVMADWQERPEEAERLYRESLAALREAGDAQGVARTLVNSASLVVNTGRFDEAEAMLREALAYYEAQGDVRNIGGCLSTLGYVADQRGDRERAAALHGEALRRFHEVGVYAEVAGELELVAQLTDNRAITVRILAAVHRLREEIGRPIPPSERGGIEAALAAARDALGSEDFDRAWREGSELRPDAAVELALGPDGTRQSKVVTVRRSVWSG